MRQQRGYGRDAALTIRMTITMLMLIGLYVVFLGMLVIAGVPWFFIGAIAVGMAFFQYFMSAKLVLATTGAKIVSAEEEPRLHATIERLAAIADMPQAQAHRGYGHARPQRIRHRAQSAERRDCGNARADVPPQRARA